MKNYSIKERQEIYEHLLTLNCPDLLAALIAERADRYYCSGYIELLNEDLSTYISNNFIWEDTPEGQEFWEELEAELFEMTLNREPTVSDVIESTEREMFGKTLFGGTPEQSEALIAAMSSPDIDFEFPTEADFAPVGDDSAKIEILVDVSKFNQEMEKFHKEFIKDIQPLSLWTRIKLFFGRWNYKV